MPRRARRVLLPLAALAAAVVVAAAPLTLAAQQAPAQRRQARQARPAATVAADSTATPFVDAHVHLNDPAMQRALMDAHRLPLAFAFWGARSDNASVLAAAQADPRLVPWVSVSPERRAYRDQWERGDTPLLAELDRALRTGAYRGIGEISVVHFAGTGFPEADFDPLGPTMRGIMTLAERHRVPVLVHCEVTRLRELEALLADFPRVTVVWAHGGYTPLVLARRLLERHPNLVYELSARTWAQHPRSPDYTIFRDESRVWPEWLALIEEHPTRFVVGTDASHRDAVGERRKVERVQLLLAQLGAGTRALVAEGNARRLVGR